MDEGRSPGRVVQALSIWSALAVLAACGAGGDLEASTTSAPAATTTTAESDVTEIVVEGGQVVGGVRSMRSAIGLVVRLVVISDRTDHVHVHGYDLFFDVSPGAEAEITFTADVPGIFEIEMEDSHLVLAELEIS